MLPMKAEAPYQHVLGSSVRGSPRGCLRCSP
jgi:hypothetical protein